jgi:PAS domain S-box-containing protein
MPNHDFYQSILQNSPVGYAHHKIVLDEKGNPCDYRFVDTNKAFEELTGLKKDQLIGQTVRQAIPGIENDTFDWIGIYGKIALQGGEDAFEQYSESLNRWYKVNVYSTESMFFTVMFTDITDSKKQKDELEGFFSMNLNFFIIADIKGNFIRTNKAISLLLGHPSEKLNGMNFFDFVHPDDIAATRQAMNNLGEGRDVIDFTNRYLAHDGTYRYLQWMSHPRGELIYASAHDITEEKLFRAELLETRATLTAVLENTFDSIWSINTNYDITYINQVFAHAFNASFGIELKQGSNLLESLPLPIRAMWKKRYDRVLNGERIVFEDAVPVGDGHLVHIEVAANPIIKEGVIIGASLFGRDITEQKKTDISLRESEEFNRRLLSTIPDLVIKTDLQGVITFANEPGLLNFPFLSIDDIIGKSIISFIHPDDQQKALENISMMFEKSLGINVYRLFWSEDVIVDCEVNGDVVRDNENQPVGMVFVVRNISERKQMEQSIIGSEKRYRTLFENMNAGFVLWEVIQNEKGIPEDLKIIAANEGFAKTTGMALSQSIGKTLKEILPGIENDPADWIGVYSKVALSGQPHQFEQGSDMLDIFYSVSAFQAAPGQCAVTFVDITERKATEKALRESEQKFRGMAENMIDVLFLTDTSGVITYISPSCKELFNYREDDITGRPFSDFLRKDQMEVAFSEFNKMLSTGQKVYNFPLVVIDAQQREIHVELTSSVYVIEGKLAGSIGLIRDVTESRKAKSELLKLSQAVEQSPASIVITSLDGKIEYVNPKFTEITGYSPEEALGQNPRILKSDEQPDWLYKELWETISKGGTWHGELLNKKKNGDFFWESASMAPIFDKDQKIINYIAIKEDITLRKAMEESLEQQSHLRKILIEISSGFINIPFDEVGQAVNLALQKMAQFVNADRAYTFDYNWEKGVCDNIYEWCAPGIEPEIDNLQNVPLDMMKDWVAAHQKGEPMYVPDVFQLPRGEVREILEPQGIKSVLSVPMMNEGRCIGFVGFDSVIEHHNYSDIEMQLLKIFAQLLANVQLRREMVEQLMVAKEKAEESDQLKTAFLQNLSHEVRTPLNGIIGFADLLTDEDNSPEEQKRYADIIIERGNQLTSIINDILTISALETGTETIFNELANVNVLIKNHLSVFAGQAAEKGIRLVSKCLLSDDEASVLIDKAKLGQILNNLFTNALKFTKSGMVELGYNLRGQFLEFYVKDTGMGIAKDKQDVIFERFAQADALIRRDFGGTGLGLSICKGFVELMGGNIRVESEPGHGATFYFTLPYRPVSQSKAPAESLPVAPPEKNITVLVAEDEETNFLLLEMILKKLNLKLIRAENGEQAVEMVGRQKIDLVLMDIKMPVMNGFTAARIIRELKPGLPIIAQTAHAVQSEIEAYSDAFDDYITKPFTKHKIENVIKKYFFKGR